MVSEARIRYLDGQRIVTKAPPWHLWVTLDVFLSGVSSGTFAVAALLYLVSPVRFAVWSILGFFAAFVIESIDLVCLIADLGDSVRFHHMLRMFKPRSPMSLGVWLSAALATFAFAASVLSLLLINGNLNLVIWLRAVSAIGLPFALGVAGYKGVLLSATAQPVWSQLRWLGAALSIGAGACGLAVMLALASAVGDTTGVLLLRPVTGVVLAIYTLAVLLTMGPVNHALAPRTGRGELIWWNGLALYLGAAIPAALAFLPRFIPQMEYIILFAVLIGSLAFRHVLVIIPHRMSSES